jgi:hypothetical protein
VTIRIVYWGVGLAGKTSNLLYVHARTPPERRSAVQSRATDTERLLTFSIVPASLASRAGKAIRVELATVPGAVFYDASRTTILEGVDGIVLVIDTQAERLEAAIESVRELAITLRATTGRGLGQVPLVVQYNKRDLPNALPRAVLDDTLLLALPRDTPVVEAVAPSGSGVFDTLKACVRNVLDQSPRSSRETR